MENTCEPVEKLQSVNVDSYPSIINATDVDNVPMSEENISELIQEQVQETNIPTSENDQVQKETCVDAPNISDNIDSGFCAETQNLANDDVEANVIEQSEHEFSSSDLVTVSSSEVDTNQTESGICDSLCQEESAENPTQFTCEELLSTETVTAQPSSVNSEEIDLNQLKGDTSDSTAIEENVNSVCAVQDVESTPSDSDQIVSSVAEIVSSDHLIKSETEENTSETCNSIIFTTMMKDNETEENELDSSKTDHKEHSGVSSDAHVIVNDNIIIPVQSGHTILDEAEGHFIVQEDGTIQKINESDESEMPHNGVCVTIDQNNFENENTLLVIEEIATDETEITAGSNESIQTVERTSSDIVEEQLSSLISEGTENKETHEKTSQQESPPEVKNVIKKVNVPLPDQIMTDSGKPLKIPAHVLGRNIDNPVNDLVSNRKVPPKPRLGVKIPYRNLTSQIVSKQEIANVIMERSKMRNAAYDPPVGGDVFFAKKLTQRLARKLAPNANTSEESKNESKSQTTSKKILKSYNTRIENDSDLLAILEGDGDDTVKNTANAQKQPAQKANKLDPETEKLIALKQLQQLPKRRKTDVTSNSANTSKEIKQKTPIQSSEQSKDSDLEKNKKEVVKKDDNKTAVKDTSKTKTSTKDEVVESRFASNVPLKTYARKRKNSDEKSMSLDEDSELDNKIEMKTETTLPPDTYVTKSSRVIKKKIIWDPDEVVPYSTKVSISKQISPEKKNEKPEKKYDKSPEKKAEKPVESKPDKMESKSENKDIKKAEQKVELTDKVEKKVVKPIEKKVSNKNDEKTVEVQVVNDSDKKKKKIILVKKKYKCRTEVDKLLMDEGAINMLYEVRNDEQSQCRTSKRKSLVNKANEIKSDLESSSNKESPKSLRKKNSPSAAVTNTTAKNVTPEVVTRKKSRDSIRSSVHTPPASPSYTFPAEASRIIRRHSSSSFDSEEEEDEEAANEEKQTERVTRKRAANTLTVTKTKKVKRSQVKENLTLNEKNKLNEEMSKNFNNLVASSAESATESTKSFDYSQFKKLSVTRTDKLVCVTINSTQKKTCTFSLEILKELCKVLSIAEKDDLCNALALNSNGESFCHGIHYKQLVAENEEARKKIVTEMANCVYDFLKCLVKFPKIIVAGVHGDVVGIGVMMLPLFDMVLASDESTFSIPCSKLGCIAEGSFVLSHFKSFALASELLFASQTLTSDEAVQRNLITRTVWREKFLEELNTVAYSISENSRQSMEVTKKLLRKQILSAIEDDIKSEKNILIEYWLTEECQKNFSKYKVK